MCTLLGDWLPNSGLTDHRTTSVRSLQRIWFSLWPQSTSKSSSRHLQGMGRMDRMRPGGEHDKGEGGKQTDRRQLKLDFPVKAALLLADCMCHIPCIIQQHSLDPCTCAPAPHLNNMRSSLSSDPLTQPRLSKLLLSTNLSPRSLAHFTLGTAAAIFSATFPL